MAERHSQSRVGNEARSGIAFFAVFLALGLIVAYLNRGHVEQQSNYVRITPVNSRHQRRITGPALHIHVRL